jgi:hypothetical protein
LMHKSQINSSCREDASGTLRYVPIKQFLRMSLNVYTTCA